ncbi:MAG: hypothetical protein ABI232_07205 [Jatrophihabitantaceae bacterium]
MGNDEDAVPQSPATWENVVDGEFKKVVGRVIGDADLAKTGEDEVEVAHEVREEYEQEHHHPHP